jgi:hypothetical protein
MARPVEPQQLGRYLKRVRPVGEATEVADWRAGFDPADLGLGEA